METNFDMFSFSTSWNWRHGNNGRILMEEIKQLGFSQVELNYRISKEMLETIVPMVEKGEIKVSSVHNVFPEVKNPDYDTDSQLLGYEDEGKRRVSIELTKGSVDYAAELGAKAVVIHPGEVPVSKERHYDILLKNIYREGLKASAEYKALFEEMLNHREKSSRKYVLNIKNSLEEIAEYIEKKNYNIKLGIENRAMCHQIPIFTEMSFLLEELKGLPVYFWYDIGHGMMMSNLGMFSHLDVYKMKDKILGVHIHDAIGVDDHWTPYILSKNIDNYIDLIKDAPIKVLELGAKNPPEDIVRGVKILAEKVVKAMNSVTE